MLLAERARRSGRKLWIISLGERARPSRHHPAGFHSQRGWRGVATELPGNPIPSVPLMQHSQYFSAASKYGADCSIGCRSAQQRIRRSL
jgi:hypothetical protein